MNEKVKLAVKSFLGLINLMIMMGAAIFLPAMTFRFPEAWIYLLIFFGGVIIITIYIFRNDKELLQSRLKAGTISETRKAQKIIQAFASIGFIGMYILSGFDHRLGWTDVPRWLVIFSDLMLIIAMIILFIIFKKNTFLSATIETRTGQHVITTGPYAVVRHPMYSAALMLFIFTPLSLGSFIALAALPFMVAVLIFRSLDEEEVLKKDLQGYEDYCIKVKYRLIPYIW